TGHADAVRAHGYRDSFALLVQHLEIERLGVPAAQLEDVPDLDPAGDLHGAAALRAQVAVADLGGLDRPVRHEVAACDKVEHVPADLVGSGDPSGARHDPGVHQVPNARL